MPLGGLKWEDEEDSSENYKNRGAHVKIYHYVRHKHRHFKKLKKHYLPGIAGELFSFLLAFVIAWLFIQGLGWLLGTSTPLVVVESESMEHHGNWRGWYSENGMETTGYPFQGGLGIGDIVLTHGDGGEGLGDVVVYTRYDSRSIGGEPIIHRIVGIVEFRDGKVYKTEGAVKYKNNLIITPCSPDKGYSPRDIGAIYSSESIKKLYPNLNLKDFRLFITKGDNNPVEDQCILGRISFPVHEELVQGRAKLDIPYLGYVKLGITCAYNAIRGDVCPARCWWPASHPKC